MKQRRTKILALFLAAAMTVGPDAAVFTVNAEDWQSEEQVCEFESEAACETFSDSEEVFEGFTSEAGDLTSEVNTDNGVESGETDRTDLQETGLGEKTEFADGTYVPDDFGFSGGTGKVKITCPSIVIENGVIYGNILFSSKKYSQIKLNGEVYPVLSTENGSLFKIPVILNQDMAIAGTTTAMSEAHDVNYTIKITQDTGKLTPKPEEKADYTAVDAALAKVPADLSVYTEDTAKAVTDAVAAVQRDYVKSRQAEVDAMASRLEKAVAALVKKAAESVETELAVTNNTAMFKVEKAVLHQDEKGRSLTVTLSGKGYHYLYKGTYEEAVANGDNRANWCAGTQVDGKWQFTIPVNEGETKLALVAISNSYLTKYEQGKNTLERAFYPRQAEIDYAAKTLVTGDFDHTINMDVTSNVKMFKVAAAALHTVGGPNSNNYTESLQLTMGSDSFDRLFVGSAADAATAESTTAITDRKADIVVKANAMGGSTAVDRLEKATVISFHSVKNDKWYERIFTVSKTGKTVVIDPVAVAAAGITLDISVKSLCAGESFALTAAVEPKDATDKVVWSCDKEEVAKVDEKGNVTAVGEGSAVITAQAGTVKAQCKVTVHTAQVLPAIAATCTKDGWSEGKKCSVCGIILKSRKLVKAAGHKEVVLPAVAPSQGQTGLTEGKKCSVCGEILIEQKEIAALPILVKKLTVSAKGSAKVAAGKKVQLKVKAAPSNAANKAVIWKSGNTKVATVNANGVVTMKKKAGGKSVVITATAKDGSKVYGSIKLTCTKGYVKKITISGKKAVKAGKTLKLNAKVTATKNANRNVVWSSGNTKIATVNAKGVVKAKKKGTVTITARSVDGTNKKATFRIKVK